MKKYLFLVLLVSIGFSQKSYNEKHLVEQNGVWYKKFSDEVVNGKVFKEIGGMEAPLGTIKNGKKEGKWMIWYENGTKNVEYYFKNGKTNGKTIMWSENGLKKLEGYLENDRKIGKWISYSKNGKIEQAIEYQDGVMHQISNYNDNGLKITDGVLKNDLPFQGSFITNHKRNPIDNLFGLSYPFHSTYENGELKKLIEIDSNGDTLTIEDVIDGERKIIFSKSKGNESQEPYEEVKKILAFEEGLFKVYYKQRNAGGNNTIDLELENGYNVNYHSVWFMVTATKKSSNDPFSKRIAFYDVDKTSTAKASFIPYGNAVLKDIKLELTRQRRK